VYRLADDALLLLAAHWTRHERRKSRDEPKKRKRWKAASHFGGASFRFPVWVDWMDDVNPLIIFNLLLIDINIGKSWNIYVYQLRIAFFVAGYLRLAMFVAVKVGRLYPCHFVLGKLSNYW